MTTDPYWTPVVGRVADADDPIDPGGASAPKIMVNALRWTTTPPSSIRGTLALTGQTKVTLGHTCMDKSWIDSQDDKN